MAYADHVNKGESVTACLHKWKVGTKAAVPAERVVQRLLSIASNFSIKKAPLDSTSIPLNKRQSIRIIFTGKSATSSKITMR